MLGHADTLFDDVGAKLLYGKSTNVSRKLTDYRVAEAVIVEVQNVLDHVVTIRILNKGERIIGDLVDELHALMIGRVVNTTLQDAASVSVRGNFYTIGCNSIVDELVVIRGQLVQTLLDNMIPIEVLDQNDDVKAKCDDDGVDLGGTMRVTLSPGSQEINHLLDSPSPMHVQRDVDQIRGNGIANEVTLFIRRVLQQLLAKIVAEGVSHQISKVGEGLVEDDISVFRDSFLQLLLKVTATVLVFAQTSNFTNKVLKAGTSKAVQVNISALVFGAMKAVHFCIGAAYTPRDPKAVSGTIMVIKRSRASAIADAVVKPGIRIKAIRVLLIAEFVIDVINRVHDILLTKAVIQGSSLQPVEIEGRSIKLGRNPGERRTQITPAEIPDGMRTSRTESAAQTLKLYGKRGARSLHQMRWSVGDRWIRGCWDRSRSIDTRETV